MRGPSDASRSHLSLPALAVLAAALPVAPVVAQQAPAVAAEAAAAGPGARPTADTAGSEPVWLRLIEGGATLAALAAFDPALRRERSTAAGEVGALPAGHGLTGTVAEVGNTLGDWQATLPWVAGLSMAVGGAAEGWEGVGRATALLAGVAAGSFANEGINQAVGRARPSWEEDALSFDPFSGHASFPSGHAAFAFSIAGGVDAVTEGWLPAAAAYAAASTAAYARVHTRKHWLSDVVVGSAVGALVSRAAARRVLDGLGVGGASGDRGAEDGAPPPAGRPRGPRAEMVASPAFLGVRVRF